MNPAPDATSPDAPLPERWRGWLAATVAAFLLLLLLLRPVNYSDSFNYAKHIVDQQRHWAVADSPFYDFGHLLWRPLGWLAWAPLQAPLRAAFHGDDILAAGAVLIALSMAGGLLGVVLLFLWIARSTRSAPVAATASIGFACTNALLYYTPTGMAYAAGLACQTGAFAWLQYALGRGRFTLARGALAGLLLGLSIAIWFPFALTAGGVVVYAAISESAPAQRGWRTRAAGIAGLIGATAALLAVTYGAAILMLHYTSIEALSAWIARSRYGKSPDRGLLRMLGGIPAAFSRSARAASNGSACCSRARRFPSWRCSVRESGKSRWSTASWHRP